MANTFFAASGHKIGKLSNEPDYFQEAKNILITAKSLGKNILLPIDVVVGIFRSQRFSWVLSFSSKCCLVVTLNGKQNFGFLS